MRDLDIKYVVAHGNLIEFERNAPTYHDDDLDVRMDITDLPKWNWFCSESVKEKAVPGQCDSTVGGRCNTTLNLQFDERIHDMSRQIWDGIQVWLVDFELEYRWNHDFRHGHSLGFRVQPC